MDTIVCMDGSEVIGAYMAEELERGNFPNQNMHHTVYVVTPEFNINNQMIFRDIWFPPSGEERGAPFGHLHHGTDISRSMECIDYYGGNVQHICSVFSAIEKINGHRVESIFTTDDVPGYQAYEAYACPFCKNRQKLDAMVNGYGYSKL